MFEITVPKLNSNDTEYVLTAWHFADGDTVPAGTEVAVVETSKSAQEVTSDQAGVLQRTVPESGQCRPGEVIGRLFPDEQQRRRHLATATAASTTPAKADGLVITEPARRLMNESGIDTAALLTLGKPVIGTADVQRLLSTPQPRVQPLSRGQLAVAEVVTASHRTIPAGYAVVCVVVDEALTALRTYSDRERVTVRVPELLIRCVAELIGRFPLFFATALDDGTAALAGQARVGVTIDVGRGLSIPVLNGPALRSLRTIAAAVASFRAKAVRDQFAAEDLSGATIAVSLPAGEVLLAQPLVPPGLSCMLALGATHTKPDLNGQGELVLRRVAYLGLSYDHRLINGRDAAQFLGELKAAVESPERLAELAR